VEGQSEDSDPDAYPVVGSPSKGDRSKSGYEIVVIDDMEILPDHLDDPKFEYKRMMKAGQPLLYDECPPEPPKETKRQPDRKKP